MPPQLDRHARVGPRWILYVDTTLDFYPPAAAQLGVPFERLIVVRATRTADALWVCEQSLHCRAIAAVVVPLRHIDAYATRRLQLAAEAGGGLALLLRTDERPGQTFAATRLLCEPVSSRGHVGTWEREKVGTWGSAKAGRPAGIFSAARRLRITILKRREGPPCEPFWVELPDAAHSVFAPAVPGDGAGAARRRASG